MPIHILLEATISHLQIPHAGKSHREKHYVKSPLKQQHQCLFKTWLNWFCVTFLKTFRILYIPIFHNSLCLRANLFHKLLSWNALERPAYSQEHFTTMVYATFVAKQSELWRTVKKGIAMPRRFILSYHNIHNFSLHNRYINKYAGDENKSALQHEVDWPPNSNKQQRKIVSYQLIGIH